MSGKCERHNIQCELWTKGGCSEDYCIRGFDGSSNCEGRGLKQPPEEKIVEPEEHEEVEYSEGGIKYDLPPGPPEDAKLPDPRFEENITIDHKRPEVRFEARRPSDAFSQIMNNVEEKLKNIPRLERGVKYDKEKLDFSLLPWDQLELPIRVLMFGAKKYDRDNWKKVNDGHHRYLNALARHLSLVMQGEQNDIESKLPHLAHIIVNALFALYFRP